MLFYYCTDCNQTMGIHTLSDEDIGYCPFCGASELRCVDEFEPETVPEAMENEENENLGMRIME